jgi:hypothetical protein
VSAEAYGSCPNMMVAANTRKLFFGFPTIASYHNHIMGHDGIKPAWRRKSCQRKWEAGKTILEHKLLKRDS